jgi:hypothetical protein
MGLPTHKDQFRNRKGRERALRLRERSVILLGVWLLNFFLFIVGFYFAFSTGVSVFGSRRGQPRVIVNKGDYRQLGTPAYVSVVSHETATGILTVVLLPYIVYLRLARLTMGRGDVDRGAI